jgi:hypothetical protein
VDQSALQNILTVIQEATLVAGLVAPLTGPISTDVAAGSQIAFALEGIVKASLAAHQAALGAPMDLSKLHQITPS